MQVGARSDSDKKSALPLLWSFTLKKCRSWEESFAAKVVLGAAVLGGFHELNYNYLIVLTLQHVLEFPQFGYVWVQKCLEK